MLGMLKSLPIVPSTWLLPRCLRCHSFPRSVICPPLQKEAHIKTRHLETVTSDTPWSIQSLFARLWVLLLARNLPVKGDQWRGGTDPSGLRASLEWGTCAGDSNQPVVHRNSAVSGETNFLSVMSMWVEKKSDVDLACPTGCLQGELPRGLSKVNPEIHEILTEGQRKLLQVYFPA